MSETKFTPGPYKAEITGASPVKIIDGKDNIVGYAIYGPRADVDAQHPGGVPVAEANARLFAAAPELYSACEIAHAMMSSMAKQILSDNPGARRFRAAVDALALAMNRATTA